MVAVVWLVVVVFFFKQTTAYEMRISDWSSDVCSSDLSASGAMGCTTLSFAPVRTLTTCLPLRVSAITSATAATKPRPSDDASSSSRSEERRVGKSVSVRVDLGGRRIIKKKQQKNKRITKCNEKTIAN